MLLSNKMRFTYKPTTETPQSKVTVYQIDLVLQIVQQSTESYHVHSKLFFNNQLNQVH